MSDNLDTSNPYRTRTPWGTPAPPAGPTSSAPIGVFDSGVGGLTVARAIMDQLPHERIIYVGDTRSKLPRFVPMPCALWTSLLIPV